MFFQKNIVRKYVSTLPADVVADAWSSYHQYFLDADIQANIRQSKEEQFQEGFLRELFVKILGYTLNPSPEYNLITEQKNETNAKKADGAILQEGNVIGVIELKDHRPPISPRLRTRLSATRASIPNADMSLSPTLKSCASISTMQLLTVSGTSLR